jgi:hypothetical protein
MIKTGLNYNHWRLFTWGLIRIIHVRFLQYQYKTITKKNIKHSHSNQVLSRLKLINDRLYYFKSQFGAWGWYHYSCVWSKNDKKFFEWLFPEIKFEEIDIVVWYKHEALNFYLNQINYDSDTLHKEIIKKLKEWYSHT